MHHRYLFQQLGKLNDCSKSEKQRTLQQMYDYAINMDYDQHDEEGFDIKTWCMAQLKGQNYLDYISANKLQAQTA
jgi:hypothetical protein